MYLIIGGRGFLGSYLIDTIRKHSNEKIIATYHSGGDNLPSFNDIIWKNLDISNESSIESLKIAIDSEKSEVDEVKCVYVIGYIKPDDCLKNPNIAVDVNIRGLANFIRIIGSSINGLIFTSTDFVQSESLNNYKYSESDVSVPINFYGNIKLACESIVKMAGYVSVRLPFMFGNSLLPNRPHFIEHIERTISEKKDFEVLSNYYENSLNYRTVAKCIFNLYEKYGCNIQESVINICSDDAISKYEIALKYAKSKYLDTQFLKSIKLEDADFFLAKRGTILVDNSKIKSMLSLDYIATEV